MSIDINKQQVDIENLFKQNVNDLASIKDLYKKLKELEEKISQIKYIDSTLAKKLKKEYESLKKQIFDENTILQLDNKVDKIKNEINSQLETKANKNEVGSPLIASDINEMTDTTRVYVNTTDGNWYSYNGTDWVIGGVYQSQGVENESITYEKVSPLIKKTIDFSIKGVEGVNKVNLDKCDVGKYVSDTTGNLGENPKYTATHFIEVFEGVPNFIDGTSNQNYAFYDKDKRFISGGKEPYREVIETPADAKYIRFTFPNANTNYVMFTHNTEHVEYVPYKIIVNVDDITDKSITLEKIDDITDLQVKIDGTLTRVAWKYDSDNDIWLDFNKVGLNSLYQISNMYLAKNNKLFPSSDFSRGSEIFFTTNSDWIGPYSMTAKNNILNEGGSGYTGGWHGYNGDQTGSATGRNVSFKVLLNNKIISSDGVYSCNEAKIIVVNRIQAKNTKLEDGSGREVLEEKITYKVTKGKIDVDVQIKALEDINIYKYMGLQTNNRPTWDENMLFYDDSVNKTILNVYNQKVESGSISNGSRLSSFLMSKDNDYLYAWVDPTKGLGMRSKIDDWVKLAYCESYGKSYMNLIFGNSGLDMTKDEIISWNGGYEIYRE